MPKDTTTTATAAAKRATVYRMDMPGHTCPYGLKSVDLLEREGFEVDDNLLTTRAETDRVKERHGVETTPQIWLSEERVGGFDDLEVRHWLSVPSALFIGPVGAVSAFKAVYVDERELRCACVGGNSTVPLGFVSLTENVMMVAMALWMGGRALT